MSIKFSPADWENIKKNYELWWAGELERPTVFHVIRDAREAEGPCPSAPYLDQSACLDFSVPVKSLVERINYELSKCEYLEDGYPSFNLECFGPGIAGAFCGAVADNSTGKIWLHPKEELPIGDIHLEYDENSSLLCRIKEFCRAAIEFWQGQVLIGMPDLGGILDIVAVFCGTEGLSYALYDEPEEVLRLADEAQKVWYRAYNEFNEILQPINPGYTDFSKIYSAKPHYIIQCDFAYMISNGMFREFALPSLKNDMRLLPRSTYHLDGPGTLKHLDDLLELEDLGGIQWIHGDGNRNNSCADWPDIHEKVLSAGKKLHTYGTREVLDVIIKNLGSGKGIFHNVNNE
jgi:5-methyltetrahydrofolate--homocysteine methyltransferase